MINNRHPVLTTVVYGVACGLALFPISIVFSRLPLRLDPICLTLWLSVTGYGLLLCRWSSQKVKSIFFPLLFLGMTVYLVPSKEAVFCLALAGMSWIRSGICFPLTGGIRIWIESLIVLLGTGMIFLFLPLTILSWALAAWLFFLLQAIPFAVLDDRTEAPNSTFEERSDAFAQSSRRAMAILKQSGIE